MSSKESTKFRRICSTVACLPLRVKCVVCSPFTHGLQLRVLLKDKRDSQTGLRAIQAIYLVDTLYSCVVSESGTPPPPRLLHGQKSFTPGFMDTNNSPKCQSLPGFFPTGFLSTSYGEKYFLKCGQGFPKRMIPALFGKS